MIDWSKPIETKGGEPARLVDRNYNHHAHKETACLVIVGAPGDEQARTYFSDGTHLYMGQLNLRNKLEETTLVKYLNIYSEGAIGTHKSLEEANRYASMDSRLAVIKLTLNFIGGKPVSVQSELVY